MRNTRSASADAFAGPPADSLRPHVPTATPQAPSPDLGAIPARQGYLTRRAATARAAWFDAVAHDFRHRHPDGLGVDLSRAVAGDLSWPGWIDALGWRDRQPALFRAEGVMMRLAPDAAEAVVAALCRGAQRRRAHLDLALDYASPLMARRRRRPGDGPGWALGRPGDLARIDTRLRCAALHDVMARSGPGPALVNLVHRALTRGRMFHACAHFKRVPWMDDCLR
ncbi:MAG: hypothetical protein H6906_11820 [Hyphomicrobiales bacterium]|nr:hypothetical protein [Hyphomicrobiales bacterium]